jgi:Carbohydrate family 9 binding domain-like/Carbohydrate binding domain
MLKTFFTLALSASTISGFAGNLIKNSDGDAKNFRIEYRSTAGSKHMTLSKFTEDLTWNNCIKLKIDKFYGDKKVNGGVMCGGEKTIAGFPVKPNTVYKFSIEIKGTASRCSVSAIQWNGPRYYKDRTRVKSNIGAIKVQKDWVKYTGTFKTTAKAKRAALYIQMWGNAKYRYYKEGDYLLIDKVTVEEQSMALLKAPAPVKAHPAAKKKAVNAPRLNDKLKIDGKLTEAVWQNAGITQIFLDYKTGKPAKAQTTVKLIAGKYDFYLGITCNDPNPEKIIANFTGTNSKNVWKDDAVEIFFGPVAGDRKLSQFVVGAGGGRWMGIGGGAGSSKYSKWQAATSRNKDGWTAEIRIPYNLLGFPAPAKNGNSLTFEVCRQRKSSKEYSAWTFVSGNFHNVKKYGMLVVGDYSAWLKNKSTELSEALNKLPASPERDKLQKSVTALKANKKINTTGFESLVQKAAQLTAEIKYLKFKNRKFIFGPISPVADMSIPMLPPAVFNPPEKIAVSAAINEFKPIPVAILNLTDKTAAYRVFVYSGLNNGIEIPGLTGLPAEKITIRQAVRVKDSDSAVHGLMNDPLPRINGAYTITIPPKRAGLIWITVDCRGVKTGTYKGAVRVIPLSEPAKFVLKGGWKYQGPMQDMPLSLKVLPITLPRDPAIPLWLMRRAGTESFFTSMIEHDNRIFQFSPYSFTMKFDAKGNVVDAAMPGLDKRLAEHLAWSKKHNVKIKFLVGFSAYGIFNRIHAKRQKFKVDSPAWKNAWQNWLRGVEKAFTKQGVNPRDITIETFDEPHPGTGNLLYSVSLAAKESGVKMLMQITVGAKKPTIAQFERLLPLVDDWCMWGSYFDDIKMMNFIKKIKLNGKKLSFYYCNTNMRASLYRYYRRHAWIGKYYGCSTTGLFALLNGPGGFYGRASWKNACTGAIVYNSMGKCIPSIRYEALRLGTTDLKYLTVLEKLIKQVEKSGKAPAIVKKAKKFVKDAVHKVVITQAHDQNAAPQAREGAIKLILELQNKLK